MQIEVSFRNGYPVIDQVLYQAFSKFEDSQVLMTLEQLPMKHSDAQRRYLNGVVVKHFQELWREVRGFFHHSIVKAILKQKFLRQEVVCEITGEIFEVIKDTRDLNKSEYDLFIQECRLYYLYETGEEIPYTSYYRGKENG